MKKDKTYWLWLSVPIINFLLILSTAWFYTALPLDGSSGDSSSFTAEGFVVHQLIEVRPDGLEVGDIITSIEGASIEEWLHQSPFGRTWQNGEMVEYEIIRDKQPISLQIHLAPVPFQKVISHWGLQILTILGLFSTGIFLFWKRPYDQTVRWIMFFSTTIAVQYWIDAYSIQPATLLWGWVFWFQKLLDQFTYSLPYASLLLFILAFLYPNSLLKRHPITLPSIILLSGTIIKWIAMTTASTMSAAFLLGNWVSVIPAMTQMLISFGLIIYFYRTSQNKIVLAQLQILLIGAIPAALITLIYSVSLALTGTPIISQDTGITLVLLMPLSFALAILRYQIFNIEIIIKKGLVYGSLTLFLGGFYIILVIALTFLLQAVTFGFNQDKIVFIATLSIALLFNPLKQRIQLIIDHTFFRSKVDYQRLLPEMSAKLSNNIFLDQLTQLLTEEIPHQLQISDASLDVFDTDKRGQPLAPLSSVQPQLEEKIQNQAELSIPLIVGRAGTQGQDSTERLIGRYNLGAKLSAKPYSDEEVNLLTTLGKQAAVSVENAHLYQQVERYNRILEQRILERTQELADAKNIAENANTLLEKVLNNIDALIYVSDIQTGEILFANHPLLEEYGDIQGKICWQALYKDKSAPCQTCSNAVLLTDNDMPTGAHRQEIQDTLTKRWYSLMSSAIQWTDGRMVRLATRMDITESKETQMKLEESEERLALALNIANSGLWDFNPHTFSDTHLSDGWFSMLGYGPNDLPNTADTWSSLVHPAQLKEVFQAVQDHIDGKGPYNTKFQMKTKKGAYIWIHSVGKIVEWDEDGHPKRMIGLHFDIDKQIEIEELLLRKEQETAREKERRKLARDLHDTLTQSLHSLVLMADTSQRLLEKERYADLPDSMQLLSDSARQSLREMRLLLHELQLSEDKQIDLEEALSTRLGIVEHQIGIKTELKILGQKHLPKTFSREIFYIVVEALNNSIKHSYAKHILVSIQASPEKVELIVKDNGKGFGEKSLVDEGMGFQNMQYRAEKLNGTLQIDSTSHGGTEIRLSVDLPKT